MNILFVCSSNICRSPYCEYMLRKMVEEDPKLRGRINVCSSAVLNHMHKMDPRTRAALLKEGFTEREVDAHKPGIIWKDTDKFQNADIIIGMTKWHKTLTPFYWRSKCMTLSEAATGEYVPVKDPWTCKTTEEYDACMEEMKAYLKQFCSRLNAEQASRTPAVTA